MSCWGQQARSQDATYAWKYQGLTPTEHVCPKYVLYGYSFAKCQIHCKKKKKLGYLKILSQPAKADFWVFSTYFLGNFSTFCCINLKQEVEKTQKSAEAGCLKF